MFSGILPHRTKQLLLVFVLPVFAATGYLQGFFERLDHLIYDLEITVLSRPARNDIVIIAVDERSLNTLGQWPWPRRLHAQMLEKLTSVKPKAIGLDILFAEPDFDDPAGDSALVDAIRGNGRIVVPVALEELVSPTGGQRPVLPWPTLGQAAAAVGHVRVEIDNDGVSRGIFLEAGTGSQRWPAFAQALRDLEKQPKPPPGGSSMTEHSSGNRISGNHYSLIPFAGPSGHFRHISYVDVLWDKDSFDGLQDTYILVGMTASGLAPRFATPAPGEGALMTGVEFNANVLAALLNEIAISRLAPVWNAALSAVLVLMTVLSYGLLHSRKNFMVVSFFALLTIGLSCGLLRWFHLWYAPATALMTLALSYPLWTLQRMEQVAASLLNEKERARATLHAIGDALVATDTEGLIDYMNPVAEELTGCELSAAKGRPIDTVFTVNQEKCESDRQLGAMSRHLKQGKIIQSSVPHYLLSRDGTEYAVRIAGNPIIGAGDRVTGMVFALSDITEILKISRKMAFLSTHDPLTELPNRVTFQDRLGQAINNACRFGSRLAVLFIDLDGFKKINDGMGHIVGDLLLKDVGGRLRNSLRLNDSLARWGGDEFVIILERLSSEEVVTGVALKIIKQLSELAVGERCV